MRNLSVATTKAKLMPLEPISIVKVPTVSNLWKISLAIAGYTTGGLILSQPAAAESFYAITDLGSNVEVHDINNSGQVAGSYYNGSFSQPFRYSGGNRQDLDRLSSGGSSDSYAYSLNDKGQVAGQAYAQPENYDSRAVLWDSTNQIQDLGSFPGGGFFNGAAYGINNLGQVVGQGQNGLGSDPHAFLYNGGPLQDLGTLGGDASLANSINDTGHVVGFAAISPNAGNLLHAFLYNGGPLQDLGTLGGQESQAASINNKDQVVGFSNPSANDSSHAFYWDSRRGIQDLGVLAGFSDSFAQDINNQGEVVGNSTVTLQQGENFNFISHAFIYSNGKLQDLNNIPHSSGWDFEQADAINDYGQIVGEGTINGELHAFIATPVPEPRTIFDVSVALGFGTLIQRKYAKRHKSTQPK